jgi:hypothetical protein
VTDIQCLNLRTEKKNEGEKQSLFIFASDLNETVKVVLNSKLRLYLLMLFNKNMPLAALRTWSQERNLHAARYEADTPIFNRLQRNALSEPNESSKLYFQKYFL